MEKSECELRVTEAHAAGDIEKAKQLCESDACSQDTYCQRYLGWFYRKNNQLEESFGWYSKAAAQGSPKALTESWGVANQIWIAAGRDKAAELCMNSPCSQLADCQRLIAKFYADKGDTDQALAWYMKAADQGDAKALYGVGTEHRYRKEYAQALDYYHRSIAAGRYRTYHVIGDMYRIGLGVEQDLEKAKHYYAQGASHGFIYAKARLRGLQWQFGGYRGKLFYILTYPAFFLRLFFLAVRNPGDLRLADIPNVFAKNSKKQRSE